VAVFFSVGVPHPALITTSPVLADPPPAAPQVFASVGFEDVVREWLEQEDGVTAIAALNLRSGESLHVARNESMVVLLCDRDIEKSLESFARFASRISKQEDTTSHVRVSLPPGFEDLEVVARQWVIHDDEDRREALEKATGEQRANLMATIGPRLSDIGSYLRDLGRREPLPDDAIRLQTLAELCSELLAADKSLLH
jgi:hypothetical protein